MTSENNEVQPNFDQYKKENPEANKTEDGENTHVRNKWASKTEFLLSCIGLSVGIGNVWRFPYLAYQNGGGAFLVAYFILLMLVGKPLYFMELAIGQFAGVSAFRVWRCFPLAQGVGAAMMISSVVVAIYYNVIMMYTLYYVGQSFRTELPWSQCHSWWGADSHCYSRSSNLTACESMEQTLVEAVPLQPNDSSSLNLNKTIYNFESSINNNETSMDCHYGTQTPAEQFWEHYVLQLTSGIDEIGTLKWDLALSLLVCWIVVYLGLIKGIRSSGKIVYFTATFPYLILVTLLIYGFTLQGAMGGLRYFFVPEWHKLLRISVWRAAGEQLLFSLGIGFGSLIMYSSYNDFHNKLYRDAMFVSALDFFTSIMSGVVIFSVLGHMSFEMGIDISKVAKGGQGLAFVTYPEAIARLPVPQLWSVLFFFMLFLLAIDSEFALLENLFTFIFDEYPRLEKKKSYVILAICILLYILGLPCVTQGGQYVLNLMDRYGGGYAGLCIATFENIMIMWGYGAERFTNDIEFMLGFRPGMYWQICWKYVSPVLFIFVVICGFVQHEPISYHNVLYPTWAEVLGWCLMLVSVIQIPIWALAQLYRYRKDIRKTLRPNVLWGPSDTEMRRIYQLNNPELFGITENSKGVVNLPMVDTKF